jgi:predicted alpha/beta superfamily hydrolase
VAADGSIGLGEYLSGSNENWKAIIPPNTIIITISHGEDWEDKRRRDFIPSDISLNTEENFGRADLFYAFIKTELIPYLDKKFSNQKSKSFIGHSFSGLFCLYAALKNEKVFDNYFAISPSVWANHNELLKIEDAFSKNNKELNASIHIYVGGLEIFNKVISSSTEFYNQVKSRNYKNLTISYESIGGANHFSVRKPAIDKILLKIDKLP